ncbi:MAG: glycosyltransferase [Bacteroidales bacterium]|nr:glycosyltransferase [Bacteroidales bacterium]MDD4215896.1 glycosyltransferase [Bacteroidales bacterium]MDY0141155.1 glycosyltransferase [Bacteroidales bacterium]
MIIIGKNVLTSAEMFFYTCTFFAVVSFVTQIIFHTLINLKLAKTQTKSNESANSETPFVSVVIAAKNEAKNLNNFLPKVLEQNYPAFEVILVNDGSSDNTAEICVKLSKQFNNLRIIHLKKSDGKKNALTKGILASKGEYLLFTDADCFPVSPNWINGMINQFSEKKSIVLGYGAYNNKKDFLSNFIKYDSFLIAIQYFYAAKIGKAYMGVGRNMAYKKSVWESVNGFQEHIKIASGDDDLFVGSVANKNNVAISVNKDAFTYSIPSNTLKDFIHQKTRHISTSIKYSSFAKVFSSIEIISRSLFYISILCLLFSKLALLALILASLRLIIMYFVGKKTRKIFNIHISFYYFVLFDTFAPIFYLVIFLSNKLRFNNKKW